MGRILTKAYTAINDNIVRVLFRRSIISREKTMDLQVVTFDKKKTSICKGIAALLLIFHHLFYLKPELYVIGQFGQGIPYQIAEQCRVCLSIFTILSGYGIKKKFDTSSSTPPMKFCFNSVKKLYLNYLFYVAFSLAFMAIAGSLWPRLGTGIVAMLRLVLSMTATQFLVKNLGINIVWWYITMLLCCYISFPLINRFLIRYPKITAFICIISISIGRISLGRIGIFEIISWMAVFYFGCFLAIDHNLEKIAKIFDNRPIIPTILFLMVFIIKIILCTSSTTVRYLDFLFALLLMLSILLMDTVTKRIDVVFLSWVGSISMGIYYIHLLWIEYVPYKFVYFLPNSIVMFFVVFALSVATYYILDRIKRRLHYFASALMHK